MTKVKGGKMLDIKEYLKQTKTVLLTQDTFDELMQRASVHPDLSSYSDKLWRSAYERGKAEAQAEIIRCRDCIHLKRSETNSKLMMCQRRGRLLNLVGEFDFCSRAERRTDGTD